MELFYPPGPASVPDNLTRATPAYRRRAWLAMGGLMLFVAGYVFLSGWFAWTSYRLLAGMISGGNNAFSFWGLIVGLCAAFLALFMIKAFFFIKHGGASDDVEITAAEQPRLFAFLRRLADEAGAPRPWRVFVSPRVNAAVFYDLSIVNLIFPSRKNLEIGLGLVNVLSLGELKAVLAHEFGHFAQRSMAVGRWVYMAQQIAAHVVAKRDIFDRFLKGLSDADLRVAWVGWTLQLIVWAIRSIIETGFNLVVLMQRALSREMEMQADLVSVSLTGSDALIHALHRLQAADEAWDRTLDIARAELLKKRVPRDLFAVQSRVIERTRTLLADPGYGNAPPLPQTRPEAHRVFQAELAQPPRMWSTHPQNSEREANAKRVYVAAPLDESSAWALFDNAQALRERVSVNLFVKPEGEPASAEELKKAVDAEYDRESLKPLYRGVYLGRSVVRHAPRAADLCEPLAGGAAPDPASLYPASIAADLERLRALEKERVLLEAVRAGTYEAPDGVIRHRGRALRAQELPQTIEAVGREAAELREGVLAHDRRCRSVHRAIAARLQGGWEAYLVGLAQVLHYADHSEANLRDAQGALANVVNIETATRRVSKKGIDRVLAAASALYEPLAQVFAQADEVALDAELASRLDGGNWKAALDEFKLPPPTKDNIGDWLDAIDGWVAQAADALSALKQTALDQLLVAEADVARRAREGASAETAPSHARVPADYRTLVPGTERARQRRLGWWARFQTAEGFAPATARFAVAAAIVGAVLGFGGTVGTVSVVVYNGLGRPVIVALKDNGSARVAPFASVRLEVEPERRYHVEAKTADGTLIEAFDAQVEGAFSRYIYNVASASPLVEWTATYGQAEGHPDRMLGTARWSRSTAGVLFEEPPKSISTDGKGGTREVLTGFGESSPDYALGLLKDEATRNRLIATRARWDTSDSPYVLAWLSLVGKTPETSRALAARLAAQPNDVLALRAELDSLPKDARESVCARHRSLAAAAPEDANLQYIADRCIESRAERSAAFIAHSQAWPRNSWLAYAAGYAWARQSRWTEALPLLELAYRQEPALAASVAIDAARIRRLLAANGRANLADLKARSAPLRQSIELETGEGVDGALRAYALLSRGRLEQALATAKQNPEAEARVVRLAAASDGANANMIERALALPADRGLDQGTVWAAIGLALREKQSIDPYMDTLRQRDADDVDATLKFIDAVRAGSNVDAAENLLDGLAPEMQGNAYSIAAVMLGSQTPARWRERAQRLLFANERPYFQ